ncbi:WAPL domain containing protein [Trichuris trichiura]|uniref:WAPL domain containing protein n=1 Tax=Trichuris trichiura TaxID=36087 RepID=A0A077ZRC8_TRITR|nr:WAPL domain containing protein [Trichuris trichiura]
MKSNGNVIANFTGKQTHQIVRQKDGCEVKTVRKVNCLRSEKPVYTVVPNVRSAEECQRIGEVQEYNDEAVYFLDSITVSNSLNVRYLRYGYIASKFHFHFLICTVNDLMPRRTCKV